MSSQNTVVNIPTANVGDSATPTPAVQNTGSVYRTVQPAVTDGQYQDNRISATGEQYVVSDPASPGALATAAKQDTGNTSLGSIDGKFTTLNAKDFATSAKQDTGNTSLGSIDTKFTTLNAKDFATSAKQDTGNTSLGSIDTKLTSQATGAKQDTGNTSLASIDGKFTTLNAKDFATSAKQDTGNTSLGSIDGKFTTLNAKDFATSAKQDTGNTSLASIDSKLTAPIATKAPVNTNGSHATGSATTGAATLTKPANAIGFILQASDQNTANIRWRADGTNPTAAAGMQLQPGRDTGYIPLSKDVIVITESGTQEYEIHWVMSS